jgi:hypothetical protein
MVAGLVLLSGVFLPDLPLPMLQSLAFLATPTLFSALVTWRSTFVLTLASVAILAFLATFAILVNALVTWRSTTAQQWP